MVFIYVELENEGIRFHIDVGFDTGTDPNVAYDACVYQQAAVG